LRRVILLLATCFSKALNVLDDLRSQGILSANDEVWANGIADEIAKCDTALGE
jgi:hypothetical protein